jgi:hypothetical protein
MATLDFSRRDYVLERHRHDPGDPYWCLRVCEEVRPGESSETEVLWASALARVASHDPTWFTSQSDPNLHAIGLVRVPPSALARVEAQIAIADPSLANYVKGLLWSIGLRFEKPPPVEYLRHAADLLERLEPRHRTRSYYEHICYALEHVDYDRLKTFFAPLVGIGPPADRGEIARNGIATAFREQWNLVFVLVAAGREGDWETFEVFRERYQEGTDPHFDCKVANYDGLYALAHGRGEDLEELLAVLLQRGANVRFLGVRDDTAFVEALIARGLLLDGCRAYLEMVLANAPAGAPIDERILLLLESLRTAPAATP